VCVCVYARAHTDTLVLICPGATEETHLHMLQEEEQAHNLLGADQLQGKLKHNTHLQVSGHQTGGRTLSSGNVQTSLFGRYRGWVETDKHCNEKSEPWNVEKQKQFKKRLCTEWLWCSVQPYIARPKTSAFWSFKLFSWLQTALLHSCICFWLLLSQSLMQLVETVLTDQFSAAFTKI
jgi:transposase-like protein